MKNIGEYVIYKKEVCKIIEIKKNYINSENYYFLRPVYNDSLNIKIPVDNKLCKLRSLISKEEVNRLINLFPTIEVLENEDSFIEKQYKELIASEKHEDLIKIIKTSYLRMKEKEKNNKKICESDKNYYKLAEKYLYEEFSITLGISYTDVDKHIKEILNNL